MERLLQNPKHREGMQRFMAEWMETNRVADVLKEPKVFDLTDAMRADMQRETAALVEDVVFTRNGSLKDLLTADYTFVNASLAKHYGIAGVTGTDFVKAPMPHDPGILAHGSMMAGHGGIVYSSPTLRGKLVRTRLLCENLPPPPDDVDTMIKAPENAKTTRQIFQAHVENPVCGPCHQTMDPIGFGFEQYDVVGRFRTQENGVPVDATGEIVGSGLKFNGLKELVDHLADNDAVRQCMVRFMAYSSYGAAGWADDGCTYDAISNEAKSQNWSIRGHADRRHAGATLHHPGSVGGHAVKLNRKLNRRTLIRGGTAGLVLAPFYNLLAPKQAKAAIRDKQRVLIFHTQPCNTKEWNPTGYSGENSFTFAPMMAALNEIKQHVVLVDGLSPKQPGDNHFSPHALTGVGREGRPDKGIISIEQFIGDELEKTPNKRPIKNLILGTSAASEAVFYRNNARLQTIASPLSGYNTVFGNMTAGMATTSPSDLLNRRKSILDLIKQDASELSGVLGPSEKQKLELHLDSIRQFEMRIGDQLSKPTVSCSKPAAPGQRPEQHCQEDPGRHGPPGAAGQRLRLRRHPAGGGAVGQQPHLAVRHAHRPAGRAAHGHHPRAEDPRRHRHRELAGRPVRVAGEEAAVDPRGGRFGHAVRQHAGGVDA